MDPKVCHGNPCIKET
ncbi:hypothetical protein [[Phormidium] sp. LEGE 05292]